MEGLVLTRPAMVGDDAEASATGASDSGGGSGRAGRPLPSPFTSDPLLIDALSSNLWYKPPICGTGSRRRSTVRISSPSAVATGSLSRSTPPRTEHGRWSKLMQLPPT
ncbi:unnamed protein product [Urochloa humidicola]